MNTEAYDEEYEDDSDEQDEDEDEDEGDDKAEAEAEVEAQEGPEVEQERGGKAFGGLEIWASGGPLR